MSVEKSRKRIVIEIIAACAFLVGIFILSEGLLRERVGPETRVSVQGARYSGPKVTVEEKEVPKIFEEMGTVRMREASVAPRIQGVIEEITVDEGDRVEEGEILARLAAPELSARVSAAAGAVSAARAALEQARSDFARMEHLFQRKAATRQEWERSRTAVRVAEANLRRAEGEAEAAEAFSDYSVLKAPFDGTVIERSADPGDLASPGILVFRIVRRADIRVEVSLGEETARELRPGDEVDVEVPAAGWKGRGRIGEIIPATDPASRSVIVKIPLPGAKEFQSGQAARVRFTLGSHTVVVVPKEVVRTAGTISTVRVVDEEGRLVTRFVRLGRGVGKNFVEILSGLEPGEKVAESGERRQGDVTGD